MYYSESDLFVMRVNKKKLEKILIFIEVILIVFQSGTIQSSLNADSIIFKASQIIMLIIAFYFTCRRLMLREKRNLNNIFFLIVICEMLAIMSLISFPDSFGTLEYKIIVLFMYSMMVNYVSLRYGRLFEEAFYRIIIVIVTFTLIIYVITGLLRINLPHLMTSYPESPIMYTNYYYLFYTFSYKSVPRMMGLFWEPGVYQIYQNFALFLYIYLGKNNKKQLAVLLISILFTQSTTGYMMAIMFVAIMIIRSRKFTKESLYIATFVMAMIAIIGIGSVLLYKRATTNIIGDSYMVRMSDTITAFRLFLQKPIFGFGFYNTEPFMRLIGHAGGNSNGLLTVLYTMGLFGITLMVFPFIRRLKHKNYKDRILQLGFFVYILFINIGEPIYALPIMIYFIAREYFCVDRKKTNDQEGVVSVSC